MRPLLLLAAAMIGCRAPTPPPPQVAAAPASAPTPGPAPAPLPAPPPAPTAHAKSAWTPADEAALDRYAAFSADDLAFAFAEKSEGAGLYVITLYAVPTNTIEKRLVLDSAESRRTARDQLDGDGFPPPAQVPRLIPGLAASIDGNEVKVTMAKQPAAPPFKPFASGRPVKAEIVATSLDGRFAAVRSIASDGAGEFGPVVELRFVKLFE